MTSTLPPRYTGINSTATIMVCAASCRFFAKIDNEDGLLLDTYAVTQIRFGAVLALSNSRNLALTQAWADGLSISTFALLTHTLHTTCLFE